MHLQVRGRMTKPNKGENEKTVKRHSLVQVSKVNDPRITPEHVLSAAFLLPSLVVLQQARG
jgi:hypothetical protein